MPSAQNVVTINRPVGEVFAFLADAENDPKWRPGVKEIHREGGAPGVGTIYRQSLAGPMGRTIPGDVEITEFEPDRLIAFHAIAGPVRPRGRYEVEGAGEGATRVTFSLEVEVSGAMKLMKGKVQKTMDGEVAHLADLKRVLESGSGQGASSH
jgi:carbon monoxide dehydrogenase subunit G